MNLEPSHDKTTVRVRFVAATPDEIQIKIMKNISVSNPSAMPSVFQVAAFLEEFTQALAAKTVRRLDEMPFAGEIRRWEEQVRKLKIGGPGKIVVRLSKRTDPPKQELRIAAPRNEEEHQQ